MSGILITIIKQQKNCVRYNFDVISFFLTHQILNLPDMLSESALYLLILPKCFILLMQFSALLRTNNMFALNLSGQTVF